VYLNSKQADYIISDSTWISNEEIRTILPSSVISDKRLSKKNEIQLNKDGYEYFVKVIDTTDKGDAPPFSYVKDKMSEIILQQRKKALLHKLESDLYKQAIASDKIKIYK